MKKQWGRKSYEAAADHVAKELTLLRAVDFQMRSINKSWSFRKVIKIKTNKFGMFV